MLHYFLGLEVWQRTIEIFLSQRKYTVKIFEMMDCKYMHTPMMNLKKMNEASSDSDEIDPHVYRQLIGSLMYLVKTRPDICYAVNVLSQFMSQPRQRHSIAAKHVLRYLRGTIGYGLRYASSVLEPTGICRCRLSRKRSGQKKKLWLLLHFRVCHGFLVQQKTNLCGIKHRRGRVHCVECGSS